MRKVLKVKETVWMCFVSLTFIIYSNQLNVNPDLTKNNNSHLEVRAVMVMCDVNENSRNYLDGETVRFQREELFKHSALEDCKQKLALTVKISSDASKFSGDEYIPIEHVLGADKRRIRLFNPYVLRLRRKSPIQAYKLRKIETVSGIIVTSHEEIQTTWNTLENRIQRDLSFKFDSTTDNYINNLMKSRNEASEGNIIKRHVSYALYDENFGKDVQKNYAMPFYDDYHNNENSYSMKDRKASKVLLNSGDEHNAASNLNEATSSHSKGESSKEKNIIKNYKKEILEGSSLVHGKVKNEEREFALYEINDPELLCGAHLQLFEKLISPQGKTLWNDLTKDENARVDIKNSKWSNQDVNIQYKPVEYLTREDFSLPLQNLCLIVPLKGANDIYQEGKLRDFFIVPMDDVITLSDLVGEKKRNFNENESSSAYNMSIGQVYRRVRVRTTRALMNDRNDLKIFSRGSEKYLKVPHTKPHYAQLDIEARADDNELVLVGAFGRLMTIVSDSTRSTRTILTVQASNTGLAASNFRVLVRDCIPSSMAMSAENMVTDTVMLPPRHTKSFHINIPFKIPVEIAHCAVALVNDDDETIAVRDIKIKKGDRCFCVWYCDCVCLSEDPKLLCRSLSDAQLVAAGLPLQGRTRHVRSICYPDVVTINIFVTMIGVLLALLLLGIIKAFLGLILRCVGSWGLHLILQTPRKLEQYYESSLRSRRVVYDKEGWPIHPDTKQRDIRLVSKLMEFILNMIFFIILPCAMIWDVVRKLSKRCQVPERKSSANYRNEHKKCFSSHDVQGFEPLHRDRHGGLRKWMTPQAEELSTKVLHKGLTPDGCTRPLLQEQLCCGKVNDQSSYMDSEKDDTDYVLMQMQKSKETLARSQRKFEDTKDIGTYAENKK